MDTSHLIPGELYTSYKDSKVLYMFIGFSPNKRPVFQNILEGSHPFESNFPQDIKPYKPPIIHKRYLQWYKNKNSNAVYCQISSHKWNPEHWQSNITLLSETEATYTEEQM